MSGSCDVTGHIARVSPERSPIAIENESERGGGNAGASLFRVIFKC